MLEEYLASEAYEQDGTLEDFTVFDNAVSGGAPTAVALSLFCTQLFPGGCKIVMKINLVQFIINVINMIQKHQAADGKA